MTAKEADKLKTDHIWSGIMMYGWDKKRFNKELNEYTNSKLKRAIGEIEKWKLATQHFGTSYQIINDIIEIIKKEIT